MVRFGCTLRGITIILLAGSIYGCQPAHDRNSAVSQNQSIDQITDQDIDRILSNNEGGYSAAVQSLIADANRGDPPSQRLLGKIIIQWNIISDPIMLSKYPGLRSLNVGNSRPTFTAIQGWDYLWLAAERDSEARKELIDGLRFGSYGFPKNTTAANCLKAMTAEQNIRSCRSRS